MTGELAHRVLERIETSKPARELCAADIGRRIAIETPASVYVGTLGTITLFASGRVGVDIEQGGYKADPRLEGDVLVYFARAHTRPHDRQVEL